MKLLLSVSVRRYGQNKIIYFYQLGAREARTRLVLRLLYVPASVCLCGYVCVCVRPQVSRALGYVILLLCHLHYSHERSGSYWKFAG